MYCNFAEAFEREAPKEHITHYLFKSPLKRQRELREAFGEFYA